MTSRMSNSFGMVRAFCNPTKSLSILTHYTELDDIVSTRCHQHDIIDNSLRSFLNVTTNYKCMRAVEICMDHR
jgi:hypothetical protein